MDSKKKIVNVIAAAAAIAFVTAPVTSSIALAKQNATVKCYGVNACKGKSACKSAKCSCKGQNSCKGQGYVKVKSKKACDKVHGSTEEEPTN